MVLVLQGPKDAYLPVLNFHVFPQDSSINPILVTGFAWLHCVTMATIKVIYRIILLILIYLRSIIFIVFLKLLIEFEHVTPTISEYGVFFSIFQHFKCIPNVPLVTTYLEIYSKQFLYSISDIKVSCFCENGLFAFSSFY